jgi:hypothetical protein
MIGALLVLGFLVLVGPLAYFYGADSRISRQTGNWSRRRR